MPTLAVKKIDIGEISMKLNSKDGSNDEEIVWVRRQPGDYRMAKYKVSDIKKLHWSDISGGVKAQLDQNYLCCYVRCDELIDGNIAHSCAHGEGPHRIKVCVIKSDNSELLYKKLAELAGTRSKPQPQKIKCKTVAILYVKISPEDLVSEDDLLNMLVFDGYDRKSAFYTLRMLAARGGRLIKKNIKGKIFYSLPK